MLHAEQRAEHIGIERRGVAVGGLFRHPAGLAFGAGAVDGRIQTTETRDGLIDQAAHIVLAAHVGADELRFAAELAQLSSQRLADVLMTAGNDDAVAFPRKSKGRRTPNSSQRAGNQDNGGAHIGYSLPRSRHSKDCCRSRRSGFSWPLRERLCKIEVILGGHGTRVWSCGICVISWPSPRKEV